MKKSKNKVFNDIMSGLQEAILFQQGKLKYPLKVRMYKDEKVIEMKTNNFESFLKYSNKQLDSKEKNHEDKEI